MPTTPKRRLAFEAKFTRRGHDECWEWTGSLFGGGYGQFGYQEKAHRVSYQMYVGPIPEGLHVLHKCDNRKCVNPGHLFVGTNLDNIRDMVSKGRQSAARGEKSGKAKLTDAQVLEIRRRYVRVNRCRSNAKELALEFGISVCQTQTILARKQWKHLP